MIGWHQLLESRAIALAHALPQAGNLSHTTDIGNLAGAIEIYRDLLGRVAASTTNPETSLPFAVDISRIHRALGPLYVRNGRADLPSALDAQRLELASPATQASRESVRAQAIVSGPR